MTSLFQAGVVLCKQQQPPRKLEHQKKILEFRNTMEFQQREVEAKHRQRSQRLIMVRPYNFENSFAVALIGLAPRSAVRTEAPVECLGAPSSSGAKLRRVLTDDSKEVGAGK